MRNVLLGCLLLAVTALRAVTVLWSVPNSEYSWINDAEVYFVYAESPLSAASEYVAAKNAITPEALAAGTVVNGSINKDEVSDGVFVVDGIKGVFQADALTGSNVSGYFYAVFVNTTQQNDPEYAVLGGKTFGASNGVYGTTVEGDQQLITGDYVQIDTFLGGTWTAAKTPEPTVLALLSIGLAGFVLRRKVK